MPEGWCDIEKQYAPKEHHMVTMYADEVDPHRTHEYTDLAMGVRADELQTPLQRLTLRGGREHRVPVPEPRLYPATRDRCGIQQAKARWSNTPTDYRARCSTNSSARLAVWGARSRIKDACPGLRMLMWKITPRSGSATSEGSDHQHRFSSFARWLPTSVTMLNYKDDNERFRRFHKTRFPTHMVM